MTDEDVNYRSPRTLSFWTILLLAVNLGIFLFSALFGLIQLVFPYNLILDDGEVMPVWMMFQGLIFLFQLPLRIATVVVFLMWVYRVYKNLTPLKASYTEYSAGWAVGYWFIPFVNLFRPYQVMQETWRESEPDFNADLPYLSASAGSSSLIIFWWIAFLVSNISLRIVDATAESDVFPVVAIINGILTTVAAYLAILVVRTITNRQEERAQKIAAPQIKAPPPPPNFNQ